MGTEARSLVVEESERGGVLPMNFGGLKLVCFLAHGVLGLGRYPHGAYPGVGSAIFIKLVGRPVFKRFSTKFDEGPFIGTLLKLSSYHIGSRHERHEVVCLY